jgi:hypothetical protein
LWCGDTEISQNTIAHNDSGFQINEDTNDGTTHINLNRIFGNEKVYSLGEARLLDVTNNFWGVSTPSSSMFHGPMTVAPWIELRLSAEPVTVDIFGASRIIADLTHNSAGQVVEGHIANGTEIQFSTDLGDVTPTTAGTKNGLAETTFFAGLSPGKALVSAQLDDFKVSTEVTIRQAEISSFHFPQFADGAVGMLQFQSTLILANTGASSTVRVELYSTPDGDPMELTLGQLGMDSEFEFGLGEGESISLATPGTGPLKVGYARVVAGEGVDGVVVFRRSDLTTGIALYEAGVPASAEVNRYCVVVDSTGVRDTGMAIVVPAGQGVPAQRQADAAITIGLYDRHYQLVAETGLMMAAGSHLARFVHELFEDPSVKLQASEMEGILVVESDRPVVAVTLRQNDDPGIDFPAEVPMLTTFPVMPVKSSGAAASTSAFYFPQFADGAVGTLQFQSTLVLANTGVASTLRVELYSTPDGSPMEMTLGQLGTDSVFEIALGEGESISLATPGTGPLNVGYARIVAGDGVDGVVVFRRSDLTTGTALYEAGVPASVELNRYCVVVDSTGVRDTGMAIVVPAGKGVSTYRQADVKIRIGLHDRRYQLLAETELTMAPGSHLARFVHELFEDPAVKVQAKEMEGILVVESDRPVVAVTLRQNDDPATEFPAEVPMLTTFPVMPGAPE